MEISGNRDNSGGRGDTAAISGRSVSTAKIDAFLWSARQPSVDLLNLGPGDQGAEEVTGVGKKGSGVRKPAPRFSPSSTGRGRGRGRGRGGRDGG